MNARLEFNPSPEPTLGAELELQLLDAETLDLQNGIVPLMDLYPDAVHIKPEFIQSCVELSTPICANVAELRDHLGVLLGRLRPGCRKLGMSLCGAGTHPFGRHLALITPLPRYLKLEDAAGFLAHQQLTFATHVHVGMPSGDIAVHTLNRVNPLLPALLALSANSPFWRGYDSGFASYRHRIVAANRSYGRPPYFDDWSDFESFYHSARTAGMVESMKDIHWDIRPRPNLGSLEIRVMDAQSTVMDASRIAALVHALCVYLIHTPASEIDPRLPRQLPWWLEKENHFRASHFGLDAPQICQMDGQTRPIRHLVRDLFDVVRPTATELGITDELDGLIESVEAGSGYTAQRNVYAESESCREVVQWLAARLDGELPVDRNRG